MYVRLILLNNPCIVLPVLHKNLLEGFTMTSDTYKKYVDFRLPSIFHRGGAFGVPCPVGLSCEQSGKIIPKTG